MSGVLKRYQVWRPGARGFLCICAARDEKHALAIARQMFVLPRGSRAVLERGAV